MDLAQPPQDGSNKASVPQPKAMSRHGFSVFRLKVIGAVLMLLSVLGTTVLPKIFSNPGTDNMPALTILVVCEAVSWSAIAIYAWLLDQGYRHTGNMSLYILRLLALAVITEVPYDLATSGKVWDMTSANPVFALVIALLVLLALDWAARYSNGIRVVISLAVVLAGFLWMVLLRVGVRQQLMNAGALLLGFVVIFHLLRNRENTMMFTAGLLGAVMFLTPTIGVAVLHYRNDELRVTRPWTRWMFYALYPMMLVICWAVTF